MGLPCVKIPVSHLILNGLYSSRGQVLSFQESLVEDMKSCWALLHALDNKRSLGVKNTGLVGDLLGEINHLTDLLEQAGQGLDVKTVLASGQ